MEQNLLYKFQKMELSQFATFEEDYQHDKKINIQTQFQFSFNKDEKILLCKCIVIFLQENKTMLKAALVCYFEIKAESLEIIRKDEQLIFDKELLVQFASLAYGSIRGAIYVKLINSSLVNIILPPVVIANMIDEPYIINV